MLHPTPLRAALLPTSAVHWPPSGSSRSPVAHRQNSVRLLHVLNPPMLPPLFAFDFAARRECGLEDVEVVMTGRVVVPKSLRGVMVRANCLPGRQVEEG